MNVTAIQSLCAKYDIRPSKKWGQNFLIDPRIARIMMDAANLSKEDCVVEVGPGFGQLTVEMVKRVKKVVAVEIDRKMVAALQGIAAEPGGTGFAAARVLFRFAADAPNAAHPHRQTPPLPSARGEVEIVQGDILKISNQRLLGFLTDKIGGAYQTYKVVASLPYSITSAALRKFTEQEPRPLLCVFLVQKEVAERVCAPPGEMSVLSVAVQYYGRPEIVATVPGGAFWPQPEVDSAILKISNIQYRISNLDAKRLFQIVRIGFSSRRKQLQNNLTSGLRLSREGVVAALHRVGLKPTVRAQELAVEDWIALTRFL